MGKLAFGLWDSFSVHEMSRSAVAADIYEQHIREVQLAESLGYSSYFVTTQPGMSGARGVPKKTLWRAVITL